jgi:hypothetical protein
LLLLLFLVVVVVVLVVVVVVVLLSGCNQNMDTSITFQWNPTKLNFIETVQHFSSRYSRTGSRTECRQQQAAYVQLFGEDVPLSRCLCTTLNPSHPLQSSPKLPSQLTMKLSEQTVVSLLHL